MDTSAIYLIGAKEPGIARSMGLKRLEQEVEVDGHPFRRKKIFRVMIRYIAPLFVAIILLSSIANAFGLISM